MRRHEGGADVAHEKRCRVAGDVAHSSEEASRNKLPLVLSITQGITDGRAVCFCFDLASLALISIHIGHQVMSYGKSRSRYGTQSTPASLQGASVDTVALQTDQSAIGFFNACDV